MNAEQTYRVLLDVKSDRATAEAFRDHWLEVLRHSPEYRQTSRRYAGKHRQFWEIDEDHEKLAVTHHEWGVEYTLSFSLGVASGIAANILYDVLKRGIARHAKALPPPAMKALREVRIDVELETLDGTARIAVIERCEMRIESTPEQVADLLRRLDEERGVNS